MSTIRNATAGRLLAVAAALTLAPVARADTMYVPASSEVIVRVNLRQILESDLVKGHKEGLAFVKMMLESQLSQNAEMQKYLKDVSFDLFRDLDTITLALPASPDPSRALVILTGRFDPKKVTATAEEAAKAHGDVLKVTRSDKHALFEITPPRQGKAFHVALVGSTTLLAAQGKAVLTGALEQGQREPALKKEVKDLLASSDPKASLSFVATTPAVLKLLEASNDARVAQMAKALQSAPSKDLEKVRGFVGNVTLGSDVQFALGAGTVDAEAAKNFVGQATFGLFAAQVAVAKMAKDDPRLAPAMDVLRTLKASAEGSTFFIRGHIPAAVIEQALKDATKR
jgi:hypothetical protein